LPRRARPFLQEWAKAVTAGKLSKSDKLGLVDHSTVDYPAFRKNFYIEARAAAAAHCCCALLLDQALCSSAAAAAPAAPWARAG
jgi:ATP-dependent RNA helicase DDX46/PRP5